MVITSSHSVSVPLIPNIERVDTSKLQGTVVSTDLKWNSHIAYVIHKANSKLHLLRQLKTPAVPQGDMLYFYVSIIRPVAVYDRPVTHCLRDQLALSLSIANYLFGLVRRAGQLFIAVTIFSLDFLLPRCVRGRQVFITSVRLSDINA